MSANDDYRRWLSEIVYKPGWKLSVVDSFYSGDVLSIQYFTRDTYVSQKFITLRLEKRIPALGTKVDFVRWLVSCLVEVEIEELHRWLRDHATGRPLNDRRTEVEKRIQ